MTFTRTQVIEKFVAAALDLERWEEDMEMVGDTTSYNEVIGAFEKFTRWKMFVKDNSEDKLKKMVKEVEGAKSYNEVRLSIAPGEALVDPLLNQFALDV